ncbi:hypothetical protein AB1A81_10500 [Bdellovibrio bacteriovorus]|uniref:Uncharacterized protein n=1 Tax=Bdellovibrio bacteriovorus (strain ATCC 15356 / DSM 50701 / NCIMB 9529 / HD100) TaxID=264462 RepID=Q6MKT8_BDEBA|nr:hypothetical protein [Bdellovibrio bacteriovorus]CAE80119.1 hypothetical protein predicted by Glimmer/Critica [Bdellovibrio bacteriovorus HD100]
MQTTEVTLERAVKILVSWSWRMMVLMLPVMIITGVLMFFIMPTPEPGATPEEIQKNMPLGPFFIMWFLMMFGGILAHAISIQWLMKVRWSDFHLVAVESSRKTE